jgi:hypothetical protein
MDYQSTGDPTKVPGIFWAALRMSALRAFPPSSWRLGLNRAGRLAVPRGVPSG